MADKVSKPITSKEDDDTRSTTTSYANFFHLIHLCSLVTYVSLSLYIYIYNVLMSNRTATPRGRRSSVGSASGFSFRLEERAEKRKEVTAPNALSLYLQPFQQHVF